MQSHTLHPFRKKVEKKRVGRGGKRGTYSGRGIKGQSARAGHKIRPALRDIIKKIPKRRGYHFRSTAQAYAIVSLNRIRERYVEGEIVTPVSLHAKRLIKRVAGKLPRVKILGNGIIAKKLSFRNCTFSASSRKRIEEAGGVIA